MVNAVPYNLTVSRNHYYALHVITLLPQATVDSYPRANQRNELALSACAMCMKPHSAPVTTVLLNMILLGTERR
jgi:hypothetical protein